MTQPSRIPYLPARIEHLADLAENLWWSWQLDARALFRTIDEPLWHLVKHNPIALLRRVDPSRLASCATDSTFLGRYDRVVPVPVADWLVVEGVGAGNPVVADLVTVLVWVEVDDRLRFERGMERDGVEAADHWRRFMAAEVELFADHGARDRADVLVDGTGRQAPRVTA